MMQLVVHMVLYLYKYIIFRQFLPQRLSKNFNYIHKLTTSHASYQLDFVATIIKIMITLAIVFNWDCNYRHFTLRD